MGISTHILDTALGRPASEVPLSLSRFERQEWTLLSQGSTDQDGRARDLLPEGNSLTPGLYRLHFETAAYYRRHHLAGFYPHVDIVFEVRDEQQHYHVPLLLTANGYTTYRGS
jgi:5-hydroxyisourate hydrolase